MAQRRHHYERAFEEYLRTRRIPYVAVDEARKALLPDEAPLRVTIPARTGATGADGNPAAAEGAALKSFDFVVYGWDWSGKGGTGDAAEARESNLLLDVKGRRVVAARRRPAVGAGVGGGGATGGPSGVGMEFETEAMGSGRPSRARGRERVGRLESWVTQDDIESLRTWGALFGAGFDPAFVFVYWCDDQPPDALFQEVFTYQGRWYALRAVRLEDYVQSMKPRSLRWRTVHVPTGAFERISRPFARPAGIGRE
jgi:hypothetical protein